MTSSAFFLLNNYKTFNIFLKMDHLSISFQPIYAEHYFWDLVEQYKEKIIQIDFELISPNMSNISACLNLDLKQLNRTTNTQKTNLLLKSDKSSYLTPTKDDPMVKSLVEYSALGGGNIKLRAKGVKKSIQTAKGKNEINIDELSIEGASPEDLINIFKGIME